MSGPKKKAKPVVKTVKVNLSTSMLVAVERLHRHLRTIDPKLGIGELLRVLVGWSLLQHEHNRKRAAARRRGQRAAAAGMAKPKIPKAAA